MSLGGSVALAAAERVHRALGARPALVAYRALAQNAPDGDVRGLATLRAISVALELGDTEEAEGLVGLYTTAGEGALEDEARRTVLALARAGAARGSLLLAAAGLAALEVSRRPRARSAYLHARCLDRLGDPATAEAFARAEERAAVEGATEVAVAARGLRVAALFEAGAHDAARALEATLDRGALPVGLVPRVARVGLRLPGRFARAAWLGELGRAARDGGPSAARAALRLGCEHADTMGLALTALELDRLKALFGRAPDERERARLLERLDARESVANAARRGDAAEVLRRARASGDPIAAARVAVAVDVLGGRFVPVERPAAGAADLGLLAVAAVRDGNTPRAAALLERLALAVAAASPGARLLAWEPAYLGAFSDVEAVAAASRDVVRALLSLDVPLPEGRSALGLARVVRGAGAEDLALDLFAVAARAREPGATEAYLEHALELGWSAALGGRRADAIRLLTLARRLAADLPRAATPASAPSSPGAAPSAPRPPSGG